MTGSRDRRPLASRASAAAGALAGRIARSAITPNQISQAGLVAALLAALCLWGGAGATGVARVALLIGAAALIQLRLSCNLLDGMVAIEAGKAAPDGPFWNEVPDRIADIAILAGAGYAVGEPGLGWAAAALAVLTAYIRELGAGLGAPADFRGPMAKPHRMALMTVAAIAACFEPLWGTQEFVLRGALWVVVAGTALTCVRRAGRLLRVLG
ncbi:MAG TPA: CDP-alcohol phosphatidyltransferase family protein [Thermohalobaculum sp.]|nr:CDP-alcohol phosphatidyltransferase family protein [Thermohalobaculum sp.]